MFGRPKRAVFRMIPKKSSSYLFIFAVALFVRLLAAVFAKGYMMHDDHFLIIESSAGWVDGYDYNYWLPWSKGNHGPSGHSFFYPGIHYLLFSGMKALGMEDPQSKMLLIRILHAFFSLLIVWLGIRLAERLADSRSAVMTGWILALLAFLPNFSVRNLVEMVCIPPLMGAVWYLLRFESERLMKWALWSGVLLGIAAGIRYQAAVFGAGLGLYLLMMRQWLGAILLAAGFAGAFFLTQISDLVIWKKPFAEFGEYVRYNLVSGGEYIVLPWYTYLLTIAGALIPPFGLFLIAGFLRNWRKHLIVFLPVVLFVLIHSLIGNKQERFILPALPFMILSGSAWCVSFMERTDAWARVFRASRAFFWVINTAALAVLTFSYGKKARVEAMYFLYQNEIKTPAVIEYSFRDEIRYPPQFYSGSWEGVYAVDSGVNLSGMREQMMRRPEGNRPEVVLFYEDRELESRIRRFSDVFGPLSYLETIEPSWFDVMLHRINPNNRLEVVRIYRIELKDEPAPKVNP
jgi:hypothetical protein